MSERTTQTHVDHALHRGNGSYRIHNVLIVGGFNVWAEGRAGTTAREAYNALRVMTAALALVTDIRESNNNKGV